MEEREAEEAAAEEEEEGEEEEEDGEPRSSSTTSTLSTEKLRYDGCNSCTVSSFSSKKANHMQYICVRCDRGR